MKLSHGKNTKSHAEKKSGGKMQEKNRRREEAIARNSAWEKLPIEEKIGIILQRPGKSTKQLEKLQRELANQRKN